MIAQTKWYLGIPSFNPHPPRRRMLPRYPRRLPAGSDLSILIRHEGGCYACARASASVSSTFQSSSATKADATIRPSTTARRSSAFNPHPPRRRMLRRFIRIDSYWQKLSILIRHEGGCYLSAASTSVKILFFQSSSATKADATFARSSW